MLAAGTLLLGMAAGTPSDGPALAAAAPPAAPGEARVAGHFRYSGGAAEIAELDRAIESVVGQMNFLIRGIARKRLRKPNLPSAELQVIVANGNVTVSRPGRPGVTTPADGRTVPWTSPDGEHFMVSQRVDASGLVQRFQSKGGLSQNIFRLTPDGRALEIETHIQHRRLPAELRFRTSYRRD
jgi:hypothetical protein